MGHISVCNQLDGALVSLQLFFRYHIGLMIMKVSVHTGNGLDVVGDGPDIMRHHDDRHPVVPVSYTHLTLPTSDLV